MDASLPSYEAAMRDSREYLRRRDLSSQDEIPLYFAWQRLYAAANANLSTDFMQETRAELRARQEARLAPRRGVPPPLFTSFDKVNRTSSQASAFLRSSSSSEAAIEMMARRYRREAEKLRSSRGTLMGSLGDAEKRKKKPKRRLKNPVQEVEELLEAFERPRTKSKSTRSSDQEGNRTKRAATRTNASQQELDGDEDDFKNAEVLPESKVFASTTKSEFGFANEKDAFASELGVEGDAGKAAELRRSSFSGHNPAATSSFSTVAAFAAQVADWKMPDNGDGKIPSSKTPQKKTPSVRKNSLGGASELRGSTLVEAEMDTTFEGSSLEDGASEEEEEGFNEIPASPINRRRTKRGEANDTSDVGEVNAAASSDATKEEERMKNILSSRPKADLTSVNPPRVLSSSSRDKSTTFQQKLIQLSHAVGDMQVKIQGKQIEVSFKGSLDDEEDVGEVDKVGKSPIRSETKKPSVVKKVLDTALRGDYAVDDAVQDQATAQAIHPVSDWNGPRKQSNVRFADMVQSDGNDDDEREPQAASVAPAQEEERGQNGSERGSSARSSSLSERSVAGDASGEETVDKNHLQEHQHSNDQQEVGDDFPHERSEEGQLDEADFVQTAANPASNRTGNSTRMDKSERLEERRSESVAPLEQRSRAAPSRLASSVFNEAPDYGSLAERLDGGGGQFDEQNDRIPPSQRTQHVKGSQRASHREDIINDSSSSDRQARATKHESRMSRSRKEPFDDESGSRGSDSRDFVPKERERRHSSRIQHQVDRSPTSSRDERVQDRGRERGQSRNQAEELVDSESGSDEDLSDGPDTPHKRHHNQRHYPSSRHQSRGSHEAYEYRGRADSRRISSRSKTSRQEKSYSKPSRNSLELSDESDSTDRSDYERREEHNADKFHRSSSRPARRSESYHTNRSPAHSRHESSRRERHFTPAVESRRDTKSKRESRACRVAGNPGKLPEGIVWPPGMEQECVARLGLDGHHPIAPPGLEHLVTKEQWGEYWTWLHWYSSWQMWYMKNGKKPKHKSDKRKHGERRRSQTDESSERYDDEDPRNANWWVDVAPSKHRHRR